MEKAYKHNEQVIKDETHRQRTKTVLLRENMVIESLMKDMK